MNATFLPSGESASSLNWLLTLTRSTAGPAGAPRRVIGTSLGLPPPVSIFQILKLRSKTISLPPYEVFGQRTPPALHLVVCLAAPPVGLSHMLCAPPPSH